ncbi:MAG: ATP-binding protein [Gloeomargarita sp. HHBFW_bins_205]
MSSPDGDRQLQALVQTVEQLQQATTPEQLWRQAAQYLAQEVQATCPGPVWVWLASYDPERQTLVGRDGVVPNPKEEGTLLRQRLAVTPGDVWQRVLAQGQPLDVPDWNKEGRRGEWGQRLGRWRPLGVTLYPWPGGTGIAFLGTSAWGAALKPDGKLRVRLLLGELVHQWQRLQAQQQRQRVQQAGEWLMHLMEQCWRRQGDEERLAWVLEQLRQVVGADQTVFYRYDEAAGQFCWQAGAPPVRPGETVPLGVLQGLYQELLLADRVVISDAAQTRMPIGAAFWQQHQAQALLAAPVYGGEGKQLLGFCACLRRQPWAWDALATTAVQGVARLLTLLLSLADLSQAVARLETELQLHIGVARAMTGWADWQQALQKAGHLLDQQLPGDRWLLVHRHPDRGHYDLLYQGGKKRPLVGPLPALHELDAEVLGRDQPVLWVTNWQTDLKLLTWRQTLQEQGVQAVLVTNTTPGQPPDMLLVLAHSQPYPWSARDGQLAQAMARQLGVVARQWWLQQAQEHQTRLYQALVGSIGLWDDPPALVRHLAQTLQVPQVVWVQEIPGTPTAQVVAAHPHLEPFAVATDAPIPWVEDPLLQRVLSQPEPWGQRGVEVEPVTRRWLTGTGIARLLAVPVGRQRVLMLLDGETTPWPAAVVQLLSVLAKAMAQWQSLQAEAQSWRQGYLALACQGWWQQQQWPEWAADIKALLPDRWLEKEQQVQRWLQPDLTLQRQMVGVVGLLRRAVARVQDFLNQKQLWFRVHPQGLEKVQVWGDGERLEFILAALLRWACHRSPRQGRVDVWLQLVADGQLEVAITDYGPVAQGLLEQLRPDYLDNQAVLVDGVVRELGLCRHQVRQMGGELRYEQLPDGRFSSRLWLPLAL